MSEFFEIKTSAKYGRGLYAIKDIPKGTLIEESPVVLVAGKDRDYVVKSLLALYVFEWAKKKVEAVVFGYGSLFNHGEDANVTYSPMRRRRVVAFKTTRFVRKGSQLLIDYGYDPKEVARQFKKGTLEW